MTEVCALAPAAPHRAVGLFVRTAGAALAVLPFLPPIFARLGKDALAARFDAIWEGACHRMPERTLSFLGTPLPICSRCLGLFVGLGLGLAIAKPYFGLRWLRIVVSIAATLLFVELTTQDLGWHPVWHATRLLTGFACAFPIGAAIGHLATRGLEATLER